jgi:hypothetical protein
MTNIKLGGAEPKKVATLGGLLVVLLVVWWFNSADSPDAGPAAGGSSPLKAPKEVGVLPGPPPAAVARREGMTPVKRAGSRQQLRSTVQDFKPKLFDKDNPVDPTKVDPTLGTQIMARLQGLRLEGGGRSLFDFGSVAAADVPKGPIFNPKPKPQYPFVGPRKPEPEVAVVKPPPPPPPPIPLKFYGYEFSPRLGKKRAFFLEGEDIYIAAEGESMKSGKYKLIKIGVNSAVVEDVANKNQQSLPLVEEQQQAGND